MISGACDVIVTKSPDNLLKSTPFYVRFGKKHIFKLANHRVILFVNDEVCSMAITINKQGSIVFEKEDDEDEEIEEEREEQIEVKKRYNLDLPRIYYESLEKEMRRVRMENEIFIDAASVTNNVFENNKNLNENVISNESKNKVFFENNKILNENVQSNDSRNKVFDKEYESKNNSNKDAQLNKSNFNVFENIKEKHINGQIKDKELFDENFKGERNNLINNFESKHEINSNLDNLKQQNNIGNNANIDKNEIIYNSKNKNANLKDLNDQNNYKSNKIHLDDQKKDLNEKDHENFESNKFHNDENNLKNNNTNFIVKDLYNVNRDFTVNDMNYLENKKLNYKSDISLDDLKKNSNHFNIENDDTQNYFYTEKVNSHDQFLVLDLESKPIYKSIDNLQITNDLQTKKIIYDSESVITDKNQEETYKNCISDINLIHDKFINEDRIEINSSLLSNLKENKNSTQTKNIHMENEIDNVNDNFNKKSTESTCFFEKKSYDLFEKNLNIIEHIQENLSKKNESSKLIEKECINFQIEKISNFNNKKVNRIIDKFEKELIFNDSKNTLPENRISNLYIDESVSVKNEINPTTIINNSKITKNENNSINYSEINDNINFENETSNFSFSNINSEDIKNSFINENYAFHKNELIQKILKSNIANIEKFKKLILTFDSLLYRRQYKETRVFYLHKKPTEYENLASKFSSFYHMLTSNQHLEYLIDNHKELYHVLFNVIFSVKGKCKENINKSCKEKNHCKNKKSNCIDNKFCKDSCINCQYDISFSHCFKQKINKQNFRDIFEIYRERSLEKTKNLIVYLKGCNKKEFFIFYDLFTDLFFYLRNLVITDCKSKKNKFEKYVEKKINEKKGYSFFKNKIKRLEQQDTFQMSNLQLKRLNLKEGKNKLTFQVDGSNQSISIDCYLWNDSDKLVISDIDGTITKSDTWGHVCAIIGKDWTHYGIAELYTKIKKNGYKILYLSSRPIEQIGFTKNYLAKVFQDGFSLPEGPVLLSPKGIFGAIYTEIILRKPEEFKIACLRNVKSLFSNNPYFAGFGNRKTDVITYKTVGVPTNKIYTVDSTGRICLEYSMSMSGSYLSLNSVVDCVFPNKNSKIKMEIDQWWKK
ncbi:lipin Ned1 [Gurleya vavrai]